MRVVFFGTPTFALPALRALARDHTIALVVTQPDRPAGRRKELRDWFARLKEEEAREFGP